LPILRGMTTAQTAPQLLVPGTPGMPSHILVSNSFADCARLSDSMTAVIVVPEWSPAMRRIFTALESGKASAPGGPLASGTAFVQHLRRAASGMTAYDSLSKQEQHAVEQEFSQQHNAFSAAALPHIGAQAGISLSVEPYPQHILHSVYAHHGNRAVMAAPQHMVLLNQDGLESARLARKGSFYMGMASYIQLHEVADAKARLWRVPTGAFALLNGPRQFIGHDWQGQPAPRYVASTMGGAVKGPLYIPSHVVG